MRSNAIELLVLLPCPSKAQQKGTWEYVQRGRSQGIPPELGCVQGLPDVQGFVRLSGWVKSPAGQLLSSYYYPVVSRACQSLRGVCTLEAQVRDA